MLSGGRAHLSASQDLQHREPGGTRTQGEGLVDAGNVCCRQLEISCTRILRGVLGSRSFGNGKESGAANEELERHLARGGMLQFGYFVQHSPALRVWRRECSMT